jgi:hypothetical protein
MMLGQASLGDQSMDAAFFGGPVVNGVVHRQDELGQKETASRVRTPSVQRCLSRWKRMHMDKILSVFTRNTTRMASARLIVSSNEEDGSGCCKLSHAHLTLPHAYYHILEIKNSVPLIYYLVAVNFRYFHLFQTWPLGPHLHTIALRLPKEASNG